ncbi:MAG: hypothetical protein P8170_20925 [Gemmatimonadota bacterium]|jgi:hypothetical protein
MSRRDGDRRWTDPRDGRSYSVHCSHSEYAIHVEPPSGARGHWRVIFTPEEGGPTLVAVAGGDRIDVDTLDDEQLASWLDEARVADLG